MHNNHAIDSQEGIDLCKKHGLEPVNSYTADGKTIWLFDIPKEHAIWKDYDFLTHCVGNMFRTNTSLAQRFCVPPPLFLPVENNQIALAKDAAGEVTAVMGRSRSVLDFMLTNPKTNRGPRYITVQGKEKLFQVIDQLANSGVTKIQYFVAPKVCEVIAMKDALTILKRTSEKERSEPVIPIRYPPSRDL
jgi:hypothetical protein